MRGEVVTFPQVYAGIETARLLDAYARGPERIRRALRGLDDEQLRARPIQDKWSAFEIGMHVADSELVGAVRMRMVLGAGSEPTLPLYDQDRWSRELRYQEADAAELDGALDLLAGLRATTLPLLTAASADDWTRTGVHPDYGSITLRNLLELYADHTERHVEQIAERRELLGSPIGIEPLLPERLY